MDALSLIVSALAAGLSAGLTESATGAVKDTYTALKKRLSRKTEGQDKAQAALAALEEKPESKGRQEVLKEELSGMRIEEDGELLALAEELLRKVDSHITQQGKYNITINKGRGIVIGDASQVQQNFGKPRKKSNS